MCFDYIEKTLENTDFLKIDGRTYFDNGLFISWSNSGVSLKFKGNKIEFNFKDYETEQPIYVKLYADDNNLRLTVPKTYSKVVYDFDNDKAHTVKLLRISEDDVPLVLESIKIYGKNPEFLLPPEEKNLKLEFFGDSITAGYGVLASKDQNAYYTYEQDSTKAYAYMTAEILNAEIRTECISGQGVFKNAIGQTGYQFKRIFDMNIRVKDGYDHTQWTPDVVILNCGTNDVPGGTDKETMYKEGISLVEKVRSTYPEAKIIWTYGMMNEFFKDTFKKLVSDINKKGNKNVYYLPLEKISADKDEVGANGHPNVNASKRVSKKLAKFILKILS